MLLLLPIDEIASWYQLHTSLASRSLEVGEGQGGIWARESARGRKERNACQETIVFSIFHAQILSVKIVIGQN